MVKLSVCSLALWFSAASAFSPTATQNNVATTQLSMTSSDNADSRRSFLAKAAGAATLATFGMVQEPEPAQALGGKLNKVNAKLVS